MISERDLLEMVETEEVDKLEAKEELEELDLIAPPLLVTASDLMVPRALDKVLAQTALVVEMVETEETVEMEELEQVDGQWRSSLEEELLSRPSAMSGNSVDQEILVLPLLPKDLLPLDQGHLVSSLIPKASLIALNSVSLQSMMLIPASKRVGAAIT